MLLLWGEVIEKRNLLSVPYMQLMRTMTRAFARSASASVCRSMGTGRAPASFPCVGAATPIIEDIGSDDDGVPNLAFMVGGALVAPVGQRVTVDKKTGIPWTKALIDSGAMAHFGPIELAELQPKAHRRKDKGTMLYDVHGNEIQTDGMMDLQFWAIFKQVSITVQAFVANAPAIIIFVGKLLTGNAKLTFDNGAHMIRGKYKLNLSKDKGVFDLDVETPDLRPKTVVAPINRIVAGGQDDNGMGYTRTFDHQVLTARATQWVIMQKMKINQCLEKPRHLRSHRRQIVGSTP